MDLFRLTYASATAHATSVYDSDDRYEIFGSRDAIWNLWFQLRSLQQLTDAGLAASACPRFL